MQKYEIKEKFDLQAEHYDRQSKRLAIVYNGLHFWTESILYDLKDEANILCVGVGTGSEIVYLSKKFPTWKFTAVEPSGAMLEICRSKAIEHGFIDRCRFHEGFLESFDSEDKFDAATCFLVSQFILSNTERMAFFSRIAQHLISNGHLISADLSCDVETTEFDELLKSWCYMMLGKDSCSDNIEKMKKTYAENVSILPPSKVAELIESSGFEKPIQFFKSGLVCAWQTKQNLR